MENNLKDILKLKSWEETLIKYAKTTPILIYGMGDAAERMIDLLSLYNINISGVFASDEFVRNHQFKGMEVLSLSKAQDIFGDFIVVPAFALYGEDCSLFLDLPHKIIMPNLPVFGDSLCNKDFISSNFRAFNHIYNYLADDESRKVLSSVLRFNITGDITELFSSPSNKYRFTPHNKTHIDGGAYDGDTIEEYITENPIYKNIIAIEPSKKNFEKLQDNTKNIRDIFYINKALWSSVGAKSIKSSNSGRGFTIENRETSYGDAIIQFETIDNICDGIDVGSIKLDCEGSDIDVLYGGVNTISEQKPQIAVAVYHKAGDLYEIPRLLRYYNPNYSLYLRKIDYIPPWDVFCFAKDSREQYPYLLASPY